MAIAEEFISSATVGTDTTDPQELTINYSGVTGNRCMALLFCSARNIDALYDVEAEIDGLPMDLVVEQSGDLATGAGEGTAAIFKGGMGDVSSASGSVTFRVTNGDGGAGMIATLVILSDVDQTVPDLEQESVLNTTATTSISFSTTATENPGFVYGVVTLGGTSTSASATEGATLRTNADNGANGDAVEHILVSEATDGSSETYGASFDSLTNAAVAISVQQDQGNAPVITDVSEDPVPIAGKNITVSGTDLHPDETTELWLAATSTFASSTKVQQTISGETSTQLNWDFVDMGSLAGGTMYLFAVTEAGEPAEQISSAFEITVTPREIRYAVREYVTDGTTGAKTLVDDLMFTPKACIIFATGGVSEDVLEGNQDDHSIAYGFVDESTSNCTAAASHGDGVSSAIEKRHQASGTDSFRILDPSSGAATPHVLGNPTLTATGLDFDFTNNRSGHRLRMVFFGGGSVRAHAGVEGVSNSPYTGMGFQPELIFFSTTGTSDNNGDSSFSRPAFGIAAGTASTDQRLLASIMDNSGTGRNTALVDGDAAAQIGGDTFNWSLNVTSFDADGFSWSGSDSDDFYFLGLNLDGAGIFIDEWANANSTDGTTESLPNSGIDNPGLLIMQCASRTDQGPTGFVEVRHSVGVCAPDLVQYGAHLQDLGASQSDVKYVYNSSDHIIVCSNVENDLTHEGKIVEWGSQPTIEWTDVQEASVLHTVLMLEEVDPYDEEGAASWVA